MKMTTMNKNMFIKNEILLKNSTRHLLKHLNTPKNKTIKLQK